MNSEFWNIFQWKSNGFSNRIPIGIVPSPVGQMTVADPFELCDVLFQNGIFTKLFKKNSIFHESY
jgi:hypothetical protein